MKTRTVTMAELELIAGTRVALGVGLGLLASGRLKREYRQGIGWALLAVGALTTIPLAVNILMQKGTRGGDQKMLGTEKKVNETEPVHTRM